MHSLKHNIQARMKLKKKKTKSFRMSSERVVKNSRFRESEKSIRIIIDCRLSFENFKPSPDINCGKRKNLVFVIKMK